MKIIQQRETHEEVEYRLFYERVECSGSGFSFPCDENGNVNLAEMTPTGSYQKCLNGEIQVKDGKIITFRHTYTEPAIGLCDCGKEVELFGFTNTCEGCGRDYNMSGQLLASRSQWGEETGESLSDILSIP